MNDDIAAVRECLAAGDVVSLPHDYSTYQMACDRMAEWQRMRTALEAIAKAPAWGAPDRWETTPAEVRELARKALVQPCL